MSLSMWVVWFITQPSLGQHRKHHFLYRMMRPKPANAPNQGPQHMDVQLMDPQLYADFVILCVLRLRKAGHNPILVFDGPRNYKRCSAANGRLSPNPYVATIFQNIAGPVHHCCMQRRVALLRMQQFAADNPTPQQITLYHDCCKIACETVTRETELVVISACRH